MKKLLPILIGLSLSGFSSLSQAENLMQVYQQETHCLKRGTNT